MLPQPPSSTLFPYTTLFRSILGVRIEPGGAREVARRARGTPRIANRLLRRVDRKSTRLNSSHVAISYAVFCLKKKKIQIYINILHYTNYKICLNQLLK